MTRDISVLIATYNRADVLATTLEAMRAVHRDGLQVEWVVVDNNSSDHTARVVSDFRTKLPVRYVFEPQPGKNRALNRALVQGALGDLLVFTDDDITPDQAWLQAAAQAAREWSDYSVFGGPIEVLWPSQGRPPWAVSASLLAFAFGLHRIGNAEAPYPEGSFPFGGNLWIRRSVFASGLRYPENIGPTPKGRTMGSETSLLAQLSGQGLCALYSPKAKVYHRVEGSECARSSVYRRAFRLGRGTARLSQLGLRVVPLQPGVAGWHGCLQRAAGGCARLLRAQLSSRSFRRVEETAWAMTELGEAYERWRQLRYKQNAARGSLARKLPLTREQCD